MIDRAGLQQPRSQVSEGIIYFLLLDQFDIEVPFCGVIEVKSDNADGEHELAFGVEGEGGGFGFEEVFYLAEPGDSLLVDEFDGTSTRQIVKYCKYDDRSDGARQSPVHGAVFVPEKLGEGKEVEEEEKLDYTLFTAHCC